MGRILCESQPMENYETENYSNYGRGACVRERASANQRRQRWQRWSFQSDCHEHGHKYGRPPERYLPIHFCEHSHECHGDIYSKRKQHAPGLARARRCRDCRRGKCFRQLGERQFGRSWRARRIRGWSWRFDARFWLRPWWWPTLSKRILRNSRLEQPSVDLWESVPDPTAWRFRRRRRRQ